MKFAGNEDKRNGTIDLEYVVPKNQRKVVADVSVGGVSVLCISCDVSRSLDISGSSQKTSQPSVSTKKKPEKQNTAQSAKELYNQGVKLFDSGKKKEGNELIIKAADMGDDEAQCVVGILLYMHGEQSGEVSSYKNAAAYLQKSANQGNAEAEYRLGMLYFDGKGVSVDNAKALRLFESAAEKKQPQAQMMAGLMYYVGKGVKVDYKKAVYYLTQSAEAGDDDAQFLLTRAYATGNGVKQDMTKAFEWCEKSAKQGNSDAQYILGSMYESGSGVKKDIKMARYWYEKAAAQGDEDAKESLKALR